MKTNAAGCAIIKHFEAGLGFVTEAYWDKTGEVWTIGWGFTKGVKQGDRMTEEEGNTRLAAELPRYEEEVIRLCTRPPNENQFSAMVCLSWNIGVGPKGFPVSDVLKYHNNGDFKKAAASFKNWVTSGGVKLNGLVKRREAEATLYSTPV